jgi:hypothetical protein
MKRYCVKCQKLVDATPGLRYLYDVCGVCGSSDVRFTLRQMRWLEQHFEARRGAGEQVPVKRNMLNRSGDYGWIESVSPEGLNLWFDTGEAGVESWQWGELEVEHLLPNDPDLDTVTTIPYALIFKSDDRLLMKDGKFARILWRKRTRPGNPTRFAIGGPEILGPRPEISQARLGRVFDWLRVPA